jgi:hypothetical protein
MTPSREVLDDRPTGNVEVGKGCCQAHAFARNRKDRREADRTCSVTRAARSRR